MWKILTEKDNDEKVPKFERYIGAWNQNTMDGFGEYDWSYSGVAGAGVKNKSAAASLVNYTGPYLAGKRHGPNGKMTYADGSR
jgi:hypothetical protein